MKKVCHFLIFAFFSACISGCLLPLQVSTKKAFFFVRFRRQIPLFLICFVYVPLMDKCLFLFSHFSCWFICLYVSHGFLTFHTLTQQAQYLILVCYMFGVVIMRLPTDCNGSHDVLCYFFRCTITVHSTCFFISTLVI